MLKEEKVLSERLEELKKQDEVKEKVLVLVKAILYKDRKVIDEVFEDLKNRGMKIDITENYGSHFDLSAACQSFGVKFKLFYGDDYLEF